MMNGSRAILLSTLLAVPAVVSATPIEFAVLLAEGDPAPYAREDVDITRIYFGDFNSPGQLAASVLVPRLDGSSGLEEILVATEPDGKFRVVRRNGLPLTGTGLGAYQYEFYPYVLLNNNGHVAYSAYRDVAPAAYTTWSEAGGPHLVGGGRLNGFANDGDVLYGKWTIEDDGVNYAIFARDAVFAPDGTLIYSIRQTGAGFNNLNDDIVYRRTETGLEELARDGDAAWGMPDGFRFASIRLAFVYLKSDPVFASSLVLPGGEIELEDSLFANSGDNPRLVARNGAIAPGYDGQFVFDEFKEYYTTETGRAVFHARVRDSIGGYDLGLFREVDDHIELVARGGQPAVGLPGMEIVAEHSFLYDSPTTNTTIVDGDWSGFPSLDYGDALWRIDEHGEWHLLLSSGESMEVSPGDLRVINYIQSQGFSNNGVFFAHVGFTDLSSAIVSWTDAPQPHPADANGDGQINAADYTVWRDGLGQRILGGYGADANSDRVITAADYALWRASFGQGQSLQATLVPEPSSNSTIAALGIVTFVAIRSRRR